MNKERNVCRKVGNDWRVRMNKSKYVFQKVSVVNSASVRLLLPPPTNSFKGKVAVMSTNSTIGNIEFNDVTFVEKRL